MAAVRKSVSVAMAACNGERFIEEQLRSILDQLEEKDEIVISLDPSTDRTKEIIETMKDKRIRVIDGPGKGLINNFENAIKYTKNEIIFLSDQDDVWQPQKVSKMLNALDDSLLVMHDCCVADEKLNIVDPSMFSLRKPSLSFGRNIIKNTMMGCCMAFRKELKKDILPFPDHIPMHDQWIGLVALKHGRVELIEAPLLLYRRHGSNESSMDHASFGQMLRWRIDLLKALKKRGIL